MGWWIKFTNICQTMLKLKTHSGFHDLQGDAKKTEPLKMLINPT